MKQKTFTMIVYSDPSHSFAKVKRRVLKQLGLEDKISSYSYQLRDNVYLEEDYDLMIVYKALSDRDYKVKFVEKSTDKQSRIRNYERFSAAV